MKRALLLFALALGILQAGAADYYWVNGGGNWSDLNHWRLGSSGGSIPSIVPSASDNVFFDANSGFGTTTATKTVTLDANGFCNNMNWDQAVANSPIFTRSTATYKVEVWGNLSLAPSVNYTTSITFKGATSNTFTTNGTVAGIFAFEVDKGAGTLSLADSFVCNSTNAANNILLTTGTFNAAGKTIKAWQFNSTGAGARTLNIAGANLSLVSQWYFTGTNKTLMATNSYLYIGSIMQIDGGAYNKIDCNGIFNGDMSVVNATVSKLRFTNVNDGSYAKVVNSNIIDTVIFLGRGIVYNTNQISKLTFARSGSILGNDNIIGTLTAQGNLTISSTDTTTVDSLLLAPNHATSLAGTININQYLSAQGVTCQAFTEMTADTNTANLYFGAGSAAVINNVLLSNIVAHGNITPIAVNGVDGGGNTGFTITPPASLTGTTLYWVGGAGDWNDNTHWSYTSGGVGGACIPFIYDTVIFNSASGLVSGNVVTTSGNAYCRNISWLAGVGTSTFTAQGSSHFNVYGSAVLAPAINMSSTTLEFVGSDSSATITFNGSTLGAMGITVNKTGNGALTFADNWANTTAAIIVTTGHLNMPGKTVYVRSFASNNNNTRYVDITGADIHVVNTWAYTGNTNFLQSNGSHILSDLYLNIANRFYPSIDLAYGGVTDVFSVTQSTIDSLTFTNTSATSMAKIYTGNTIRRLEFKGAGTIIGTNTVDSLIFAGSRNYSINGTTTVNKYLLASSATCTGLIEMRGNTTGTFNFNPAAVINMNNIYLQNMVATGVPAVAVSGADAGGNSGWVISSAAGSTHYWIGGSGDWNDNTHWSTTSGGAGGACIPTVYDDVYFDANSGFTSASKTVTVNNGNAYARNLDWSAATNSPLWNKASAWTIEVWGPTVALNPAATFTVSPLTLKGNTSTTMSGNVLGNFDVRISKPGGSLTLANNYSNNQTDFLLNDGTLNTAGLTIAALSISNEGLANTQSINISNATITLDSLWRYNGTATAHTLNSTGATINTKTFTAAGMSYNNVNVSGILNTSGVLSNTSINKLTFTNPAATSLVGINGTGNTIGTAEYKGGGGVYGTGNNIDTLIFFPGDTYTFTAGTNTTVNDAWYGSGTPCHLTEIYSSSTTANATVTRPNGSTSFDYARLRRITGAGAATFSAQQHTIDLGNNTNWNIATYNAGAPITGLGNDTALLASDFPYTLHTDGFFGVPSSQYLWNNNSTADSLVAADTGRYSVQVNFVDGCTVSDTIHLALRVPLSVTLLSFDAVVQNCQANLNWKVANAVNFKEFVVERSSDGRYFAGLGRIAYAKGTNDYAYTDKAVNIGSTYYRLRLMDVDGSYRYSQVVSVKSDCSNQTIAVYPTVTKGAVTIELPAGYANAKMEIYNNAGQLVQLLDNGNEGKHTIQLNGLAQGQYLLKITSNGEVHTFKLIYQL